MSIAIIPSRFGSKRFNGKPLALIKNKPMIQWVYEQAKIAQTIDQVVVATDDERIFKVVKDFGGEAMMTPSNLRSGTDRVAKTADLLNAEPNEVIINIQGDQPLFNPECLDQMTAPFKNEPDILMSTLAFQIIDKKEITDPSDVKVTFDKNGIALYFSRSQIPYPRDNDLEPVFYKHLGFYAYKKSFLDIISSLEDTHLENIEKLEQLRVLEHGYKIKVVVTQHDSLSVDLPEDIKRIEKKYFGE